MNKMAHDRFFRGVARRIRAASPLVVSTSACVGLLLTHSALASSTPITLGAATNYGLLTGVGATVNSGGGFKVTGNEGQAIDFFDNYAGTNSVSGTFYYDESDGKGNIYSAPGSSNTASAIVQQSMTASVAAAVSASSNAAALAATPGLTNQGGSIKSSVTISALTNLSENVLDLSSVSLTNGTLTFNDNGHSGAKYVINVTGGFSLSGATIQVAGGAAASDIIFNIEGVGQTVSIIGGTTLGTLLVPNSNVTVGGGGSLTGALIAGVNNAGKSYTLTEQNNGYNVTSFAYVPRPSVPEPPTLVLFGAGLAALAAIGRKRRRPS